MKLIIVYNYDDYLSVKSKILAKNPNEKIYVIYTNIDTNFNSIFKKYNKIREEDIIISKEAPYGNRYNTIIDNIWFKIKKRKNNGVFKRIISNIF